MKENKQLVEIPLKKIVQVENSRAEYREGDLAELMISMKQMGLLQPIGLKAVSKDRFEVVFGNRRFLAAKKLGWETIPAIMTEAEAEQDFIVKNSAENLVRVQVPLSEQGRLFQRMTKLGFTTTEIAAKIGIGTTAVNQALNLFRKVPAKYHDKIVLGGKGSKAVGPRKGRIQIKASKAILSAQRDFDLDKETTEKLYDLASTGISNETLSATAKLVGQGYEIKDAVQKAAQTETIRVNFVISIDEINRIEKKYDMTIRAYIGEIVSESGRIKLIAANKLK